MKALLLYQDLDKNYNLGWFRLDKNLSLIKNIRLDFDKKFMVVKSSDSIMLVNNEYNKIWDFDDNLKMIMSKNITLSPGVPLYKMGEYLLEFNATSIRIFNLINNKIDGVSIPGILLNRNLIIENNKIIIVVEKLDSSENEYDIIAFDLNIRWFDNSYSINNELLVHRILDYTQIYNHKNQRLTTFSVNYYLDSFIDKYNNTYLFAIKNKPNGVQYNSLDKFKLNSKKELELDCSIDLLTDDYDYDARLYNGGGGFTWINNKNTIIKCDYDLNAVDRYTNSNIKQIRNIIKIVDSSDIVDYNMNIDDYNNILDLF